MTTIAVVTGSTRGIGYGLAEEFLKRNCAVVINGRSQESVDRAVSQLTETYDAQLILAVVCDVSQYAPVETLWNQTVDRFGKVDYWVNNAGINLDDSIFWELPNEEYERITNINLLGVMHGSHVAIKGMIAQKHGQIFNMKGFGSDGRKRSGYTAYGTTKYALQYFTESLQKEAADHPVLVSTISPGIVITDLLLGNYSTDEELENAKRIFNILGDQVETVTPYLVEQMLTNTKDGAKIEWLTTRKIITRFMTARFNKRDLFAEE